MPKESQPTMDKKYQAEDDARTMMRAMEISKDKGRYDACLKEIKRQKMMADKVMSMMNSKGFLIKESKVGGIF